MQSCGMSAQALHHQLFGAKLEQALVLPAHLQLHEGMLGEHAAHGPVHVYSCKQACWEGFSLLRENNKGGCGCSES